MVEGEWLKNNNMDKCQKCQQEITNDNSYTLNKNQKDQWGRITDNIYLCESCFKNNETTYMKEYLGIVKGSSQVIKEPKPKNDEGQETNYFECKKCGSVRSYENNPASEFEKGCPNCQSKDFEVKISLFNGDLHYKIKECSKCHKMDMNDLIKWPDTDELKGKSKSEVIKLIKQENLNNADNCQCSHDEDNNRDDNNDNPERERERERERESKNGFSWSSPWVIGGGIVIVGIIGIIIYLLTRKKE